MRLQHNNILQNIIIYLLVVCLCLCTVMCNMCNLSFFHFRECRLGKFRQNVLSIEEKKQYVSLDPRSILHII